MRPFLIFLMLNLLLPALAFSGTLHGSITDENGQGLPFASIYVTQTASGTASNEQGKYLLQLEPGTYTIIYKFIGYKANQKTVTIGDDSQELNVQLEPEVLNLKEVTVRSSDEDPAYGIMRNAIRLRKYHQNEALAWSARVYMKSVARMDKVPGKVLGVRVVDVDTGIVYLSESISELHYKRPNKVRERVISSRVSGRKQSFTFNQASEMNISFYDNLLKVQGLSERGFVSPLANNAMAYYRYEYMGAFEENGRTISKIKVISRRKNDPVFQGNIYIAEDSWRIHSTDLRLTKNAGIDYVDFIRVQQVHAPVHELVWLPVSQKFTFEAGGLGFKGRGNVTGVYSNYKVQPAYKKPPVLAEVEPEPEPNIIAEAPIKKSKPRIILTEPEEIKPEEQQPIHDEKLFSREVLLVEEEANTRDSAYWAAIRPVPLSQEEVVDYQKKDSLEMIRGSKTYQDSLDHLRNKPTIGNFFIRGYTYRNSYEGTSFNFDPLISITGGTSIVQFNTVEGLVADVRMAYNKRFNDRRTYTIEPAVRYGFSNEKLNAKLRLSYTYDPVKRSTILLNGGRYVEQQSTNAISPFVNTLYTLFKERNYMKLYQHDFVWAGYRTELLNGLYMNMNVEYAQRRPLQNTTDYTFRKNAGEGFTANVPVNAEMEDASFSEHEVLSASFNFTIQPGQTYISRPDRKINLGSKYPTIGVGYRTGIKAFGTDVKYSTAALRISDDMSFGLFGSSTYSLQGGAFWNKEGMRLMDYKHFNGNRTIFAGVYSGFQLLDYYRYSTNNNYLEGHYEHHFNGFIFNKIPLFRRLKWQEVFSMNYLNTKESRNYLELGVGIEHIFKVVRIDFVTSFQEGQKARTGFMIGFGF